MSHDSSGASLVAHELVTGYRRLRGGPKVLLRTSFAVAPGNVIAIVGPNGVGKSTLLKTLVGLLPPLGGTVTLGGMAIPVYRRRYGIGFLPETMSFTERWSGRGMIALAALAAGRNARLAIPNALEAAGVDFDLSQPVRNMSKGMRQRLALAMVLIPMPQLLLLDEPEAGLDPAQRIRLRERIRAFARAGRIVLVASHDVSGLCTIADHTYLMNDQRMMTIESAELLDPQQLVKLFAEGRP